MLATRLHWQEALKYENQVTDICEQMNIPGTSLTFNKCSNLFLLSAFPLLKRESVSVLCQCSEVLHMLYYQSGCLPAIKWQGSRERYLKYPVIAGTWFSNV